MKFIISVVLFISANNCQIFGQRRSKPENVINSFAFDVYKRTTTGKPGNVIMSLYSIHSALAMTSLGATNGSETRDEMLNGLKYPKNHSNADIAEGYRQLTKKFDQNENLYIANKIFINHKFTIKPTFQDLTLKSFKSEAENINFSNSNEASSTINKWVEDQTNNKIKDIVTPDMCSPDTAMILVNTIYYKGIWKYKFEAKYRNQDPIMGTFYNSEIESVKTNFMKLRENLYFGDFDEYGLKALKLPYKDSETSMLLILPNEGAKLSDIESQMNSRHLSKIWDQMEEIKVNVQIPKFKIEFEADLVEPLKKMGMKKMFTDGAEFSDLIEESSNLSLSNVVHKAVIEVNEEGTEAAASTAVAVPLIVGGLPYKTFYANRPFLFYLVSNQTKQILFVVSTRYVY